MVKEFAPSASKTVVVLLNLTLRREPSFTLETFEDYMTMVGASVLQYAHDRRLPFGLTVLGEETLSSNGFSKDATHLFACYRLLAQARARMDKEPVQHCVSRLSQTGAAPYPRPLTAVPHPA